MFQHLCRLMLVLSPLILSVHVQAQTLAFPGAEGFGRFAQGGRGGTVIPVTNLNPSGGGSFRSCLEQSGARTCVFHVSGIIEIPEDQITIFNPYLTIAGQTAPGDGIIIKGAWLSIRTHDVIVRHLRARPGHIAGGGAFSWKAIEVAYGGEDVIIDHSSFSWATDDTIAVWDSQDVTFQWNIISEGLDDVEYGKGGLFGENSTNVSVLHNLFAHVVERSPYLQSGDMQMVNNVIYNVMGQAEVAPITSAISAEYVANYFLTGPDANHPNGNAIRNLGPCWGGPSCDWLNPTFVNNTSIYVLDNYHNLLRPNETYPEDSLVNQGGGGFPISPTPFGFPTISSKTSAVQAKTDVLAEAGATVPIRDSIDARVVSEVHSGTGTSVFGNISELGGYPTIAFVSRPAGYDTDGDGMPNAWESSHGLNPNSSADGPQIVTGGYSNLEVYLNAVADGDEGDPVPPPTNNCITQ